MTAFAYVGDTQVLPSKSQTLHCGAGTGLFTTSCTPSMVSGAETGLFTTSCAPSGTAMATGDLVELFTTSC
ncbi:hypothetical protein [Sulfitobacter sp.]|uniref:hypothetical protein n=1 Tax=Sulfitobacter sp. TaxID=1903071 RepID=UPI0035633527